MGSCLTGWPEGKDERKYPLRTLNGSRTQPRLTPIRFGASLPWYHSNFNNQKNDSGSEEGPRFQSLLQVGSVGGRNRCNQLYVSLNGFLDEGKQRAAGIRAGITVGKPRQPKARLAGPVLQSEGRRLVLMSPRFSVRLMGTGSGYRGFPF